MDHSLERPSQFWLLNLLRGSLSTQGYRVTQTTKSKSVFKDTQNSQEAQMPYYEFQDCDFQ